MFIDPFVCLGGLIGGIAVGLTGIGGGALLTPMLVYVFGVPASTAVGTDLVASLIMKPVSGVVHLRSGTVRLDIVRWLAFGSLPGALGGALIASELDASIRDNFITRCMGGALLLAATTITVRAIRSRMSKSRREVVVSRIRPWPTVMLGLIGGLLVGLTSVGAGSLMIVVLTMLYPSLTSAELIGTDLVQSVPLVAAAALVHVLFGSVQMGLTLSLVLGAIPGAYIGANLSSSRTTRIVKPALVVLLLATGARQLTA